MPEPAASPGPPPVCVTVLGLGNTLLGDEGVGVHVVTRLRSLLGEAPGLMLVDGGTLGLDLLAIVEDSTHLIVIDAMESGAPAGTVAVLQGSHAMAWESSAASAHDLALPSVLALARLRGWQPQAVGVVGIEPQSLAVSLELSGPVAAAVQVAVDEVLALLRRWGWTGAAGHT